MNAAQTEAIANADAQTNNAGLPTYTEVVAALLRLQQRSALADIPSYDPAMRETFSLLARVPLQA